MSLKVKLQEQQITFLLCRQVYHPQWMFINILIFVQGPHIFYFEYHRGTKWGNFAEETKGLSLKNKKFITWEVI